MMLGGGGDGASSPKAAVEQFLEAAQDGDCDTLVTLIATDDKDAELESCKTSIDEDVFGSDSVKFTIGEENVDGDTATVEVTITATIDYVKETGYTAEEIEALGMPLTEEIEDSFELKLVKDGGWKLREDQL